MKSAEKQYSVSEKFHSPNAELIFQSSDKMRFHIHRKYLKANTGAFPTSEIECEKGKDEIVLLTESSVTLELLFSFIYPKRHPELEDMPFEVIELLAEAAEKYQVFSAMHICHLRMKEFITTHPTEVLNYACRHDYPFLISAAAEVAVALPLAESARMLPPHLVMPWVLYIDAWMKAYRNVQEASIDFQTEHRLFMDEHVCIVCRDWADAVLPPILDRFIVGYPALANLDDLFAEEPNEECCNGAITQWRNIAEEEVKKIPKFKEFISSCKK